MDKFVKVEIVLFKMQKEESFEAELPPFELSKLENYFQKAEIDRSFIIKK